MQTWRLDDFYAALCVKDHYAFLASQIGVAVLNLQESQSVKRLNSSEAAALAVSGALDVANNDGRVVQIWRESRQVWSGEEHIREVTTLSWNHDDTRLASGSPDSMVLIWDARQSAPILRLNTPEGVGVYSVLWNQERPNILAAAHDTAIKLWDTRFVMKSLATVKHAHGSRIVNMHWHPTNSNLLLTTGKLGTLRVWNTSQIKISQLYHKELRSVTIAKFTPYGNSVLYAPSHNETKPTVLTLDEDMKVVGQLTACRSHLLDFEFAQVQGKWTLVGLCGDHSVVQLE